MAQAKTKTTAKTTKTTKAKAKTKTKAKTTRKKAQELVILHGVGRRKESVARVYLRPGEGKVIANGKPAQEYFAADPYFAKRAPEVLLKPFQVTGTLNRFDVVANLRGGGITGQMEAMRLGIARALLKVSEDFRKPLRQEGLLTRDARMVERKKYGLHKARRSEQYSKR